MVDQGFTAGGRGTAAQSSSLEVAQQACVRRCAQCAGCHYVSVSARWRDCSWFASCELDRLHTSVSGFTSAAMGDVRSHDEAPCSASVPFDSATLHAHAARRGAARAGEHHPHLGVALVEAKHVAGAAGQKPPALIRHH